MSDLKLEGTITVIKDKQQVTDTFAKREFVLETADEYPQHVKFECTQNKCDDLDKVKIGDEVTVHFNVRGRLWQNEKKKEDVYFVTLNAWRLETTKEGSGGDHLPTVNDGEADNLPF